MRDSGRNTLLFQDFARGRYMSDKTKRLDLQFGSFACSVQGFDDPVQPVQQVLQALQNLLEETPELGDSGIQFDAGAIDQLIGEIARRADIDEKNVEIVPGLIIVHRSDNGAAGYPGTDEDTFDDTNYRDAPSDVAESGDGDSGVTETSGASEDAGGGDLGYVNIFSPGGGFGGAAKAQSGIGLFTTNADDTFDPDGSDAERPDDPFAARLKDIATPSAQDSGARSDDAARAGDAPRDIFSDDTSDEPGNATVENIFADPMESTTSAESGTEVATINFFSTASDGDRGKDDAQGDADNLFAGATSEDVAEEPEPQDEDPARGEALFGRTEDQPEVDESDEGYTAAGIAEAAGAKSVADLMVSSAAWMVLIQGQTTFTRSEVVAVFETIPGEHPKTAESRVKGFGKAVRNGQFVQVEEGVFGLSRIELENFQRML
jgi:hypothetical protein